MRAARRSLQEFKRPAFDRVLPHLTPTRQAILTTTYDPEGRSLAQREEILAALPETADSEAFENEIAILDAWGVAEEGGSASGTNADGETVTRRRFLLTDRGDRLMDEFGDALAEHYVPRDERTPDEWLDYPVPLEHKFAELTEEVADLRARLDEQTAE